MSRDLSGIYHKPAGTDGVPGQTIESAKYNAFTADVEVDLNTARPIVAGGTGATSALAAMAALSGEVAGQIVSNYDAHTFQSGSFKSVPGATSAPVGGSYLYGTAIVYDAANVLLQARVLSGSGVPTGATYLREKSTTWGAWVTVPSPTDVNTAVNTKVSKAGDTMTGTLTMANNIPLVLGHANTTLATLYGGIGANTRWRVDVADNAPETGGNAGANFNIYRWDDAGGYLGNPFGINRQTGKITQGDTQINGTLTVSGLVTANSNLNTNAISCSTLTTNGNTITAGAINCGAINAGASAITTTGDINGKDIHACRPDNTTGVIYFGGTIARYLYWDNTTFKLTGPLEVSNSLTCFGDAHLNGGTTYANGIVCSSLSATSFSAGTLTATAGAYSLTGNASLFVNDVANIGGIKTKPGYQAAETGHTYNINWPNDGNAYLYIDATNVGAIQMVSDYRTKKDVLDLPDMWETVKALRPISYTQADFSPPSHIDYIEGEQTKGKEGEEGPSTDTGPLYKADDIERWGFLAHELQETLTASAASGVKDSPDTVQAPNPWTVIAALTRALQEAIVRIETMHDRIKTLEEAAAPSRKR